MRPLVTEELAFQEPERLWRHNSLGRRRGRAGALESWIGRAINSLPVPVSPRINTVESVGATTATRAGYPCEECYVVSVVCSLRSLPRNHDMPVEYGLALGHCIAGIGFAWEFDKQPYRRMQMHAIKVFVSAIALSSLVAACGTMSVEQHRAEAQRYQAAARVAASRGDATEAKRFEALAKKHEADAIKQQRSDEDSLNLTP